MFLKINTWFEQLQASHKDLLGEWLSKLIDFGVKLVVAILIFIVGKFIIRLISKGIAKSLTKNNVDNTVSNFVKSVVSMGLMVVLIMIIIDTIGIEVVTVAALLASIGVGIGMALSKQLQNFAAGIVMIFTKPIRVGDAIECKGVGGIVESVEIFHTMIQTFDGKRVYIPNGMLCDGIITNYSRLTKRRLDWNISLPYNTDYEEVEKVLEELVSREPRILNDPNHVIHLNTLNDHSVDVLLRVWCVSGDYWNLMWDFNKLIYQEFNRRRIPFALPTYTISGQSNVKLEKE